MNPLKQALTFFKVRSEWLGEGGHPVPNRQAQERANVCLKCPQNVERPLAEFLEESVVLLVKRQVELKNQMKLRVDGEKLLHICEACGCKLSLKVHVPIQFVKDTTEMERLDPSCWILSETK